MEHPAVFSICSSDARHGHEEWHKPEECPTQNGGRTAPPQRRGAAKKPVLSCRRSASCPHGKLGLRSRRLLLLVSRIISDARTRSGQQTAWCSGIPESCPPTRSRVHGRPDQRSLGESVALRCHKAHRSSQR